MLLYLRKGKYTCLYGLKKEKVKELLNGRIFILHLGNTLIKKVLKGN